MNSYRIVISRILAVLGNIVMLVFGILFIITVFSKKSGAIDTGVVRTSIVGIILGGASILAALFGFVSTFVEFDLTYMNYIAPVMNAIMAALFIFGASKENPTGLNCILFLTSAAILLCGIIGYIIIIEVESRETV